MANQKEYKIIINGIKESIDGIGTLQESLDKLGKKVEESGSEMKTASKGMDELAKTNQKIAEYNEEYATALAANKAVLADHNKEVKAKIDLEKAEITVQEGLTDTYAHKQQLLTALGKVIKNTTGDTSDLKAQYAQLNQELKDFDAELGNHQRSVGDYEIATKSIKGELKELTTQMAQMLADGVDKADPKFVALAKRAGELKDAIGDAGEEINRFASDTKKLDDVIDIAKSATAAFQLYKGAMSAFGMETEEAEKAIQKLAGAMSIIQSLQQLQNTLQQNTATAKLFTKAMSVMTLGIQGTTTATKVLKVALASLGIGLVIIAITTLITQWDNLKSAIKSAFPILDEWSNKFGGIAGALAGVGAAIKQFTKNIFLNFIDTVKNVVDGEWGKAWDSAKKIVTGSLDGIRSAFWKGVSDHKQAVADAAKTTTKTTKTTAKEVKDTTKEMLDDLVKMERDALKIINDERQKAFEAEKKRLEELDKLRKKGEKVENDYQKQKLKLDLAAARTDEEKLDIKKKIIKLDQEIAEKEAKSSAAEAMGMSVEELEKRLSNIEYTYVGLGEKEKIIMQSLITQLSTVKMGAEEALLTLTNGGEKKKTDKKEEEDGGIDGKVKNLADKVNEAWDKYGAAIYDGVQSLGDAIGMAMEFAIEEAEAALEEAESMHDEAVEKVSDSKDRISDLNDKMRESSGAQLEQYKQQMADEMLLLQEREQEERRLQKEKEKREKELEKQKKKQRKLELQQQLIQAIVSGALAVVNGLATQPFMPVGIAMGALAGVATAIQIATITKQMSKLADGGLLSGRSHATGGIPVGNTGIEVEGGEYVVNKRSTAKYLPLLQQINEEGARHKTVANQLGKMADGGQLNYERINSNMDALSTAKIVSSAIEGIEMHPVVSVVDINRGQRNYTEVRQLAGANS